MENKESGGDYEQSKHSVSSGFPCLNHDCIKCCTETRMPLSKADIKRISGHGYKFKDFVVKRGGGRQLRNIQGKCVFLKENKCLIYSVRPEGCTLYPLVMYKNSVNATIHNFCPYSNEFKFNKEDAEKLSSLIKKL